MAEQKQGDLLEPTYSSSVRIRDPEDLSEAMNDREESGISERGSGISVLTARDDDDDDS